MINTNKPKLEIGFVDFWPGFDPEKNFFSELLSLDFKLEISNEPEVLFFSSFGNLHEKFKNTTKIFFTGENHRPNVWNYDYSLTFDFPKNPSRDFRWPLYNLYFDPKFTPDISKKEKFACMVVSNPVNPLRAHFFHELSKRKKVDSGGKLLNNVGGPVKDKLEFIKDYKFCLAFENASWPGYTTEKLMEAKRAGCIPVYWGNPEIEKDFNGEAFINLHNYNSVEECVEHLIEIDSNESDYLRIQNSPLLKDNSYTQWSDKEILRKWLLEKILLKKRFWKSKILGKFDNMLNNHKSAQWNKNQLKKYIHG